MSSGRIRRAQLVTPFGVGAMSILVDGTSVITAGLDHWFPIDDPDLVLADFVVRDWRLEEKLGVKEFRLPPDYRSAAGQDSRNRKLSIPVLRFPGYAFCMYCKRLKQVPLSFQDVVRCEDAAHAGGKGRGPRMSQVPFVAICKDGHLDDFPFRQWVHRSAQTTCAGVLRLFSTGGGGLDGQVVRCGFDAKNVREASKGCGASRSMQGSTSGGRFDAEGRESTVLTEDLESGASAYRCSGARPWLAEEQGSCDNATRGALRAAGNVYFPVVESSIYLPQKLGAVSGPLRELLNRADVAPVLDLIKEFLPTDVSGAQVRGRLPAELFMAFSDDELLDAYRDRFGLLNERTTDAPASGDNLRHAEYATIRETPQDDTLRASDPGVHPEMAHLVSRVRSVSVLQETRVLRGFTRGQDSELKLSVGKSLLRRRALPPDRDWLPGYVVKGEGIFIEFDAAALRGWEARAEVQRRADLIRVRHERVTAERGGSVREVSARSIMVHTLSHLLMNELVFTCGYSSASIRERLYVSLDHGAEMAGLLLYTAAGDSEGTMGGLVRMARGDQLLSVLTSALNGARWCSTDPVCMELGEQGQGPDSCNLAACHGCALVPETSCEEYNRFLDRGLVIGTFADSTIGYCADASI